jgi:hypothetical protein
MRQGFAAVSLTATGRRRQTEVRATYAGLRLHPASTSASAGVRIASTASYRRRRDRRTGSRARARLGWSERCSTACRGVGVGAGVSRDIERAAVDVVPRGRRAPRARSPCQPMLCCVTVCPVSGAAWVSRVRGCVCVTFTGARGRSRVSVDGDLARRATCPGVQLWPISR